MVHFVPLLFMALTLQVSALPVFQAAGSNLRRQNSEASSHSATVPSSSHAASALTSSSKQLPSSMPSGTHSSSGSSSMSSSAAPSKPSSTSCPKASGSSNTQPQTPLQKYMAQGIEAFLQQQGLRGQRFYAIPGWQSLGLVGENALSEDQLNKLVFDTSDGVSPMSNESCEAEVSYSQQFAQFVIDLNDAQTDVEDKIPKDPEALLKVGQASSKACTGKGFATELTRAIKIYQWELGISKQTHPNGIDNDFPLGNSSNVTFISWDDKNFIDWTQQNKSESYAAPIANCVAKKAAYDEAQAEQYGDNFDLFSSVALNVKPLKLADAGFQEGINMPVGKVGSGVSGVTGNNEEYEAAYNIQLLNGTLQAWLASNGQTPSTPAFHFTTDPSKGAMVYSGNGVNYKPITDGTNGVKRRFASSSPPLSLVSRQTTNQSSSSSTSETFELTLQFAQRMTIDYGLWFDAHRSAEAVFNSTTNSTDADADKATQAIIPFANKYYGTPSNPGDLALRNVEAVVVFRPSWVYTFSSTQEAQAYKSQDGVTDMVKNSSQEGNRLAWNDTTGNAYLLGYRQENYWDSHRLPDGWDSSLLPQDG